MLLQSTTPSTSAKPRFHLRRPYTGGWFQIGKPFDFEWNFAQLEIPELPEALVGLRVIHLTDLHVRRRWHDAYDRLLDHIKQADADLLLFTGDFVDNKYNHTPALPTVMRLAKGLTAKHGCYAVLGNHDRMHFGPRLRETDIHLISGERRAIDINGATVELIGLPGSVRKEMPKDFVDNLPPSTAGDALRVVLSHFPDHLRRVASLKPHLFLAGHTHGGQCCLPGGIPIIKHDSLPRRYCSGIHRIDDTWLVVGRGFGTTTLPLRIFCPPEVVEIKLVRRLEVTE